MRKLLVGIAIVAVLSGTAVAVASIPDSSGVIHGCRRTKDGALRVIDTDAGQVCDTKTEVALSWSQTGPQGPAGPEGPPGPAGPAGTNGVSGYQVAYNSYAIPIGSPDTDIGGIVKFCGSPVRA
jgi:hypothetical protein